MFGYEKRDFLADFHGHCLSFLEDDRDAHLLFWWLDCDRQTPREAGLEAFINACKVLGVRITRNNELLMSFNQSVEGVEKFFLRAILSSEKLDIVYKQHVQRVVVTLEFIERLLLISAHHIGNVLGRVQISDLGAGMLCQNEVSNRMYEVGFTKADTSVDEQRVIGGTRMFSHLQCRRAGKLIGLSGDEIVKREFGYEAGPKRCGSFWCLRC